MSGSAAFLAPLIAMVPASGRPPRMRMRSMRADVAFAARASAG